MIDVRPVIFVNGVILLILAAAMGVPAVIDLVWNDPDWHVFATSAMVTGFVGAAMALGSRPAGRLTLSTRQAFLLTTLVWISVCIFGAQPFLFSGLHMSMADAVFETTSGLTTTGATVITGLDTAPRGILMWRALLNWLGGIGIIVMAVAILPILRIGGMQLFKMESSDKTDKVKPRTSQVAAAIIIVYVTFTALAAVALWLSGMTPFEALCHAFAALATGGFSTSDASLGHWGPATQWVATVAMIAGGSSFTLFVSPWKHGRWPFLHDSQFHWYLTFLGLASLTMGIWLWAVSDIDFGDALRHACVNVVSIVTTTGFISSDFNAWGSFAQVAFFILFFIGGCTGSTSGAIKIFRWEVLFKMAAVHIKRLLHPNGFFVIDFNHQGISDAVVDSVLGFVVMYFLTFAAHSLVLTAVGLDMITAFSASASALANVGPGLGHLIGPAGTFKPLPDVAKWILSGEMILGRLELFTVLVLFTRGFWRP